MVSLTLLVGVPLGFWGIAGNAEAGFATYQGTLLLWNRSTNRFGQITPVVGSPMFVNYEGLRELHHCITQEPT